MWSVSSAMWWRSRVRGAHPAPPARRSGRELRRILADLDVPQSWDRDQLVRRVSERRGRRLHVVPVPGRLVRAGHFGLWVARTDDDVVLYASETSDQHATHIICHEIAHMALGHDRTARDDDTVDRDSLRRAVPGFDESGVRRVFGRSSYSADQEYEAELFATFVMASRRSADPEDARSRFLDTF